MHDTIRNLVKVIRNAVTEVVEIFKLGVQSMWIGDLLTFNHNSILVDARNHTNTCMYKQAYFAGLIFAVHELNGASCLHKSCERDGEQTNKLPGRFLG